MGELERLQEERQRLGNMFQTAEAEHWAARGATIALGAMTVLETVYALADQRISPSEAALTAVLALATAVAHKAARGRGDRRLQLDFDFTGTERQIDKIAGLHPELDQ